MGSLRQIGKDRSTMGEKERRAEMQDDAEESGMVM